MVELEFQSHTVRQWTLYSTVHLYDFVSILADDDIWNLALCYVLQQEKLL